MPYVPPEDELARRKKNYYRNKRPDLDPQSTVSWLLEQVGLDEPYRNDSGSYDYAQKAYEESVARGQPDLRFGGPAPVNERLINLYNGELNLPRNIVEAFIPSNEPDSGRIAYFDPKTETPYIGSIDDAGEEGYEQFAIDEEGNTVEDPRGRNERNAGAILAALDMPLMGYADEAMAGLMSLDPNRGTYEEELQRARDIEDGWDVWEDPLSGRGAGSLAASIGGMFVPGSPSWLPFLAAQRLYGAGRQALGLTPQATSLAGRLGQTVVPGAGGFSTDITAYQFGTGRDGLESRVENIDPAQIAGAAIAGGAIYPMVAGVGSGIVKGTKAIGRGAKRATDAVRKFQANRRKPPIAWRGSPSAVQGEIGGAKARFRKAGKLPEPTPRPDLTLREQIEAAMAGRKR